MNRYAELFLRYRGRIAALVALVTVLALWGALRLEFDDKPRGIFRAYDEEYARLEELYEEFGSDDNDAYLVLEAEDWFRPQTVELLRSVTERLRKVDGIERVVSMSSVVVFGSGLAPRPLLPPDGASAEALELARREAHAHPLVGGRLLSADGGTTLVVARLAGGSLSITELEPIIAAMREVAREASASPGVRARTTGVPPFRIEIYGLIRREQIFFTSIGSVLCFFLAWIFFRHVGAVLVTVVPPILGMVWTFGAIGLSGAKLDLLGTVLPTLVIVIGFTDSVHLMIDMRRSRAGGAGPLEAAAHAIRHLGVPCALTSLTTAVGLGSLTIGNVEVIRRFGVVCAAGVILTFFAVITTLPLLASRLPSLGGRGGAGFARLPEGFGRLVDSVTARAGAVSVAGAVIVLGLAAVCTRLVPENRLTEATPSTSESFQALAHCERAFGGILPVHVVVDWRPPLSLGAPEVLAAIREARDLLAGQELLSRPISVIELIESLPGDGDGRSALLSRLPEDLVHRFVRPDLSKALVSASVADLGTPEMGPLIESLEQGLADIRSRHGAIDFHLTGTDVVARKNLNRMIGDLGRGLGFAALIIFGVIALEFRSLRIGLISLLPNVLPLALVGALLSWTGQTLTLTTAVLFTVLLGLAVDDTIHFLARLRREREEGGDRREALRRAFLTVGAAIAVTTVVLGAGFAIVLLSSVPTNRLFAKYVLVGLAAALVGDLVLLPALLSRFGPPRFPASSARR